MTSKSMYRDHNILTITSPAGAVEAEFLTEDEIQALAEFTKRLGWSASAPEVQKTTMRPI